MEGAAVADDRRFSALLVRGLCLLALWVILMGSALKDLPVGIAASAAGAWASTVLWPVGAGLSLRGLIRFGVTTRK